MKRISTEVLRAPKRQGEGHIEYLLWVDPDGGLYVQLADNAAAGTFGRLLYSVSEYAGDRKRTTAFGNLTGYDHITSEKSEKRVSANSNDAGFLKAVLCDLLPD